jgi:hypothetical protein
VKLSQQTAPIFKGRCFVLSCFLSTKDTLCRYRCLLNDFCGSSKCLWLKALKKRKTRKQQQQILDSPWLTLNTDILRDKIM